MNVNLRIVGIRFTQNLVVAPGGDGKVRIRDVMDQAVRLNNGNFSYETARLVTSTAAKDSLTKVSYDASSLRDGDRRKAKKGQPVATWQSYIIRPNGVQVVTGASALGDFASMDDRVVEEDNSKVIWRLVTVIRD
jgi:hypothetical protein